MKMRIPGFSRLLLLLLAALLLGQPVPLAAQEGTPTAPVGEGAAQRLTLLTSVGGLITAALPLPGAGALMTEGPALLRVDFTASGPLVRARQDLGLGALLALHPVESGTLVLAESGLALLGPVPGSGLPELLDFEPGGAQALSSHGDLVALAARSAGIRLLRVSAAGLDPLALLPLPGTAYDAAFAPDGHSLFIAAGAPGVHVVDIAEPAHPALLRTLGEAAPALSVSPVGALLAVGGEHRLWLLDPAPGGPGLIGVYAPLQGAQRMLVQDGYAYIADAHDGLKIIWLAAPDRLVQLYGEADQPVTDLALVDNLAYLVGPAGLRIVDVGSRYRPLELGSLALPGIPLDIHVAAGRAFISLGPDGLAVVDVTRPAGPVLLRRVPLADLLPGAAANASYFYEGILYVAAGEAGLALLDAAQPGAESLFDFLPLPGPASDLGRRGASLIVAAGEAGLLSLDVSAPRSPLLRGVLPPPAGGASTSLTLTGRRAYVMQGTGLQVVDLDRPDRMGALAWIPGSVFDAGRDGNYLYVLDRDRIGIYDSRADADPLYLRSYRAPGAVTAIEAAGDYLYLTGDGLGPDLVALSIQSPDIPYELDNVGEQGRSYHVTVSGSSVWLARGYGGLIRFEPSEGGALRPLDAYRTLPDVTHLAAQEGRLLLAGRSGWQALDWAGTRRLLGDLTTPRDVRGVALDGEQIALALGAEGLALYALRPGSDPVFVARAETSGPAYDVRFQGAYLLVAEAGGLSIYSRSNLSPVLRLATPAPAVALDLSGSYAYLALSDGSLATVALADPAGVVQIQGRTAVPEPGVLVYSPGQPIAYWVAGRDVRALALAGGSLAFIEASRLLRPASHASLTGGLLAGVTPGDAVRLYNPAFLPSNNIPRREIPLLDDREIADVVFGAGGTAYAAHGVGGLSLLVTDVPGVGATFDENEVNALYLLEQNTLLAAGAELAAWDVRDPVNPRRVGSLALVGTGRDIAPGPAGTLLVAHDGGLSIVRWDGRSFEALASLIAPDSAVRGVYAGGFAYLGLRRGGLGLVDLSNLAEPRWLFTISSPLGRFVTDLAALEDGSVMVSWEVGVERLSVAGSAPLPRLLSVNPTASLAAGDITVDPSGARAALATGEAGLALFDLADPAQPALLGYAGMPGEVLGSALLDDTLFAAAGSCGLRAFDISDPAHPREVGYWRGRYTSAVIAAPLEGGGALLQVADASRLVELEFDPSLPPVPPPAPALPDPHDGASGIALSPGLRWGPPADPCDPLTYDIYLGPGGDPPLIGQVTGEPALQVADLQPLLAYRWHIDVTDRQGDRVSGASWTFTTGRGDANEALPPPPPFFVERFNRDPLGFVILLAVLLAASVLAVYAIRRARRRTDRSPDR